MTESSWGESPPAEWRAGRSMASVGFPPVSACRRVTPADKVGKNPQQKEIGQ